MLSSKHCKISSLSISGNSLGIDACLCICQAMILNQAIATPLRKLDFSRNNLGHKGMQLLAESLRDNSTLRNLNVAYNNIGDRGAQSIAKML